MTARIWTILAVVVLIGGAVGIIYSSTILSGLKPVGQFQMWADVQLTKISLYLGKATARPYPQAGTWLPGKIRVGEIQRGEKTEKLYFVGAEVKQWDPDNGVLSLESFGNKVSFSASVRPGNKSAGKQGTMVMLPNTSVKGNNNENTPFLVPDFWEEENELPDSTWKLAFCPADAVQVSWLANEPISQIADLWGNLRRGLNIESEVITNYFRQLPCIR